MFYFKDFWTTYFLHVATVVIYIRTDGLTNHIFLICNQIKKLQNKAFTKVQIIPKIIFYTKYSNK